MSLVPRSLTARRPVPRIGVLVAAALLGVPLLTAVPSPAEAAPRPRCQGRAATIVGGPDEVVRGTDRADVIVATASRQVLGRDGRDVICLSVRPGGSAEIRSGDGDDSVRVSGRSGRVQVELGSGADRYVGFEGVDEVEDTGTFGLPRQRGDGDRDVILTRGGDDLVRINSLERSEQMTDRIDGGAGDDRIFGEGRGLAPGAGVAGGDGRDYLSFSLYSDAEQAIVDLPTEQVRVDGEVGARWADVEELRLFILPTVISDPEVAPTVRTTVIGTPGADVVDIDRVSRAAMGGGADVLTTSLVDGADLDGGAGPRDLISLLTRNRFYGGSDEEDGDAMVLDLAGTATSADRLSGEITARGRLSGF
ncbi:hypothetical protein [Nocardioides sp.]|uniref:hypothetical protein n=1 Tax=Nocardioides sp. TaxID=35761 RepID=UPI0035118FFE